MRFPREIEGRAERAPTPPARQLVPRSFGLMLRTMRFLAGLSVDEMAATLTANRGRFHKGSGVSGSLVSRLELARMNVLNWHLEAYQNWTGIPSSVIDFMAHVAAEIRDKDLNEARAIARSVMKLCEFVENHVEEISRRADGEGPSRESIFAVLTQEYDNQIRRWPVGSRPTDEERHSDLRLIRTVFQLIEAFDRDRDHAAAKIHTFPNRLREAKKRTKP